MTTSGAASLLNHRIRKASESPVENGVAVSPGVPCCLHTEPDLSKPGHALNGCLDTGDLMIDPDDPGDAMRLTCSNLHCNQSLWSHAECFAKWERAVVSAAKMRTHPGVPSKIRCHCGRGHLSRDAKHTQPQVIAGVRKRQTLNGFGGSYSPTEIFNRRFRHLSGSSNQSGNFSLSPPPDTMAALPFSSPAYSSQNRGNIFRRRNDNFESLKDLPRCKQNKFHIVTEDDSSTENDELKSLVLTTLTANKSPVVLCVLCSRQLPVYDHFPLLDGTFFLSPIRHNSESPACGKGFLHSVCLHCMCLMQASIRCRFCQRGWDGSHLLVGGIYLYDVFACSPCCPDRIVCSQCRRPAVKDHTELPNAFSHYSQLVQCTYCRATDFHFVKPATHVFKVLGPLQTPQGHAAINSSSF